nr:hypothetical protein [Tanacetum cinerariifolium]
MNQKTATPALEKKKSVPKKKGSITAEENILSDPDEALYLVIKREQASKVDKEAAEHQNKKKMKGIATNDDVQELLNLKKGIRKKQRRLYYATDSQRLNDDERIESEREVAKGNKVDDETSDEKEMHTDKEEHADDEEIHDEEEVHEDEELHDADEIHADDEETDEETDEVIADVEKIYTEHTEEKKVNNEQAGADQDAKDDQAGALIFVTQKEKPEFPPSSSSLSLSSDYESMQANVINDVKNQLPKFLPKAVSDFDNLRIKSTVREVLQKTLALLAQSSSTHGEYSSRLAESLFEYELKKILFDKINSSRSYTTHDNHQELYDALLNSMCLDETIASGEINLDKILRKRHRDEVQDPLTGKTPPKTSKTTKSVTGKESVAEPIHEVAINVEEPIIDDVVNNADQPEDDANPKKDNPTWFKQTPRPETPNPEWKKDSNIVEGPEQKLRKEVHCINYQDKGPRYELEIIEGMILRLWSPVKVAYDKDVALGIFHWGPKRKLFYRSQINRKSRHDVFFTMKILSEIRVKVDKQFGYGYLEEILVRRDDQKIRRSKKVISDDIK